MTSYQYFKSLGCKEIPYGQLPKDYLWITGCGGGDGWYYNFFMQKSLLESKDRYTDEDNAKVIICKIARV